jgi:hypothetical protein
MSDAVDRLFGEYVGEHRAGGRADPLEFLARASSDLERKELEALIDGYLARAPRRRWDSAAFAGSSAERVADGLDRALTGEAGLWPVELPRLRERAQLKRAELVARLAVGLGVKGREEKVAAYYHEMEQGLLPARGVSDRVLDALATIVGSTRDGLRSAGGAVAPSPPPASPGAVFARRAAIEPEYAAPASAAPSPAADEAWDEVDELFRGG